MSAQTIGLFEAIEALPAGSTLLLHDVSWAEYEELLAQLPDGHRFRLSYDQGTLEIITPSSRHQSLKALFAHLLAVLTEDLNLNLVGLGSTTFRLPEAVRGTEPDDCYYIQHAEQIAGRDTIDPATDPPPDLVVEVDIALPSLDKFPIRAIHFALVGPRCSGERESPLPGRRRGLPADASRVRRVVLVGGGVRRLSPAASVARRLSMPCV